MTSRRGTSPTRNESLDAGEQVRRTLALVDASGMDEHGEQEPERVGEKVPVAPLDEFAAVEASWATDVGGLDRLAVDESGRWTRVSALLVTNGLAECVVDALKQAAGPSRLLAAQRRRW